MKRRQSDQTYEIDAAIGARARFRREQLQLSQRQLANSLGISAAQLQKYETGENRIGGGRLDQMSRVLRIPVAGFFRDPVGSASRSIEIYVETEESVRMVVAFEAITSPTKRRVLLELATLLGSK
jgi:transcriptional regulator with XRE-family HTH domain